VRRRTGAEEMPASLLHYRAADWPSADAWRAARRAWIAEHPPPTLADLNELFSATTFPPQPDPREGFDAAA